MARPPGKAEEASCVHGKKDGPLFFVLVFLFVPAMDEISLSW
jgi:hypothetical protein